MFNKISCFFSAASLGGLYYQYTKYADLRTKREKLVDQINLNHLFQRGCAMHDPSMLATPVISGLELKDQLRQTDEKLQRSFVCMLGHCSEEVTAPPEKRVLEETDQAFFQHFPHGWNTLFDLSALSTNPQDARLRSALLARSQHLLDHFEENGQKALAHELQIHPAEDRPEEAERQKAALGQLEKFMKNLRHCSSSLHTIRQNLQKYEKEGCFDTDAPPCHEREEALFQQLDQAREQQEATKALLIQESEALIQATEKGYKYHRAKEFWKKEVTAKEIEQFAETSGKVYATMSLHVMEKMLANVWITYQLSLKSRK